MKLTLFFSWQMETDLQGFNNKRFLNACIKKACKKVSKKDDLRDIEIKFQEGMRATSGHPEVAREMFRKVDDCDIYVADITTAQQLSPEYEEIHNEHGIFFRYAPNCNVFGEYNRALGKYPEFDRQIILLANDVNKTTMDTEDVIPFDTRGRRWPILFHLEDNSKASLANATKELMPTLQDAIKACALEAIKNYNNRYTPLITWYKHREDGRLKGYQVDDSIIDKYKSRILDTSSTIRIIGPKDYRKAYMVMKAIENSDCAHRYFYGNRDDNSEGNFYKALDKILSEIDDVVLVLDHCSNKDIERILDIRKKSSNSGKIIFLTSDIDNPSDSLLSGILFDDKFDITENLADRIEQKFIRADINVKDVQDYIIQFCDNNEELIDLVLSKLPRGTISTENLAEQLTNIITYSEPNSFTRTVWQSIALFNHIGWQGERAQELGFVIANKNITPTSESDEYIINAVPALIKNAIRQHWVIEKGRKISISLYMLANQLLYEWFSGVDVERLKRVLKSIEDSPTKSVLTKELHDRLCYIASNEETYSIVAELLKPNGSFDSTALESNEGLWILEAFAAANPEAVTAFLTRIINSMSREQLNRLLYNTNRLVWLLEKLCFRAEQFNQNALLMLQLAAAENEDTNRDATTDFTQLFPVTLPATSANLDTRLDFLRTYYSIPEYKRFIMMALNSALRLNGNILLTGAEKLGIQESVPYMPKTRNEVNNYLSNCLDLIGQEIMNDGDYKALGIEILENYMAQLCTYGYGDIILPYIERTAAHLDYDWSKMQEDLVHFKHNVWDHLSADSQSTYDNLIAKLTKTDFVSQYARVEKELLFAQPRIEYNKRIQLKNDTYEKLATDVYEQNQLTDDILTKLMCLDRINSHPFGATLAKLMNPDEQIAFIKRYLTISNKRIDASNDILCDFIRAIDDSVFEKVLDEIVGARITNTAFICFGYRGILPSSEKFQILHRLIEVGWASVEDYLYYFYRLNIQDMTNDVVLGLLSEIQSHKKGFNTSMQICSMLTFNMSLTNYPGLSDFIEKAMIEHMDSHSDILSSREACEIGQLLLLSGTRNQLAIRFNKAILDYASQQDILFYSSYEIEQIYGILMKLYFNDIWPALSEVLLSEGESYMNYYHMKGLLGLTLSGDKQPILLEGDHWETILEWCKQHPDIAPARVAGMIPVMGENNQFSREAKQLIDLYADKPYVLNEIGCSLDSFSSVGSVIPYYEQRKIIYQTMLTHSNLNVQRWAQQQINGIDQMIEMESTREAER